jgi:aspartyl-tRNA(Asn)/glutamyl-tRNA(Gln) amidotransferase subunit C
MKKEEIEHLAKLSRIAMTDEEANALAHDISSILGYISEIEKATGDKVTTKEVGALFNIMREDGIPHNPGIYSDDLLANAPVRDGKYIKVKKIIGDKS